MKFDSWLEVCSTGNSDRDLWHLILGSTFKTYFLSAFLRFYDHKHGTKGTMTFDFWPLQSNQFSKFVINVHQAIRERLHSKEQDGLMDRGIKIILMWLYSEGQFFSLYMNCPRIKKKKSSSGTALLSRPQQWAVLPWIHDKRFTVNSKWRFLQPIDHSWPLGSTLAAQHTLPATAFQMIQCRGCSSGRSAFE